MPELKHMPIKEFRSRGYLHEVNRLVLHPLGLALEVTIEEDGTESISGVWDCQAEPEGILYGDDLLSGEAASFVAAEMEGRGPERQERLGFIVQPTGRKGPTLTTRVVESFGV